MLTGMIVWRHGKLLQVDDEEVKEEDIAFRWTDDDIVPVYVENTFDVEEEGELYICSGRDMWSAIFFCRDMDQIPQKVLDNVGTYYMLAHDRANRR